MHEFAVSVFLYFLALLFAIFEVEAEGRYGWAEKFPTWYRVNGAAAKLYGLFTNKPLTGYHAALFFVPVLIMFWPMVATNTLTLHGSLTALSMYFMWVIIWDFSWFVINPHYGVKNFRRDRVWWFSKEPWLLGRIPSGYCMAMIMSLALAALAGAVDGGWLDSFYDRLFMLIRFLILTGWLVVFGAPLYREYYGKMRSYDERDKAGIFRS